MELTFLVTPQISDAHKRPDLTPKISILEQVWKEQAFSAKGSRFKFKCFKFYNFSGFLFS